MLQSISKVNYLKQNNINKTIEYPKIFINNFIKNMHILNIKEEEKKSPSLEFTLLELLSIYDEDNKLKIDCSLLNSKLDYLESMLSTFLSSCILSSFIISVVVNMLIQSLYISISTCGLEDYNEKEVRAKFENVISSFRNNVNNYPIFKCVENNDNENDNENDESTTEQSGNQHQKENENNEDQNRNNEDNNNNDNDYNNDGDLNHSNDGSSDGNGNDDNNNNNNRDNEDHQGNDSGDDKKKNIKKENKNKKGLTEENETEENDMTIENEETDGKTEMTSMEDINSFINEKDVKEIKKPITSSLYHRSSAGSLKKVKLLGVIGSNNEEVLQYLGKDGDFINNLDNKSIHLSHELGNVNKMPSIMEDRIEEGSDIEEMKHLLKKDQGKKKGEKLSKLCIGKDMNLDSAVATDNSKKSDNYASMSYSPFSTNFELFKNPIIESLPIRGSSSGLGSHRNSICCAYDIFTNFCTSHNVRRGSLPALNYSNQNGGNLSFVNDFVTPPHSAGVSSASNSSSSASSSISSPSSNSTMVNQSNSNDYHSFNINKLNIQKSGSSQLSSSSTPSSKVSDVSKDAKSEIESSSFTTPVGKASLTHSASFSGGFNNYSLSNSSSCNSLAAMANTTMNASSSSSTLNFIDGSKSIGANQGIKQNFNDLTVPFSSMVTGNIENATKISLINKEEDEEKGKLTLDDGSASGALDSTMGSTSTNTNATNGNSNEKDSVESNGNGNDNSGNINDEGKKLMDSGHESIKNLSSNENGNVSLSTSIFDEDRSSFTTNNSFTTDNGMGYFSNVLNRGRSFSICVDSIFGGGNGTEPINNSTEYEGENGDLFNDTMGSNSGDRGFLKSTNSFPFHFYNSSRRQSCPLISSYSGFSLSKKKSLEDLNNNSSFSSNLGSMALESLDEVSETNSSPDRRSRKNSTTLNDFTGSSSTLFKEDSLISSLNYSLNSNSTGSNLPFATSRKGSDSEYNSLLSSSKSSLNLNKPELTEGLNDNNTLVDAFATSNIYLSGNDNANTGMNGLTTAIKGNDKLGYSYRKTRSYSTSSMPFFGYPNYFNGENDGKDVIPSMVNATTGSKSKPMINTAIDKSFTSSKSASTEIKNPWMNDTSATKSTTPTANIKGNGNSGNHFKLNSFTENHDYDFGFNLGWKTDKSKLLNTSKMPSTDLYNINEVQLTGNMNDLTNPTSKTLSSIKMNGNINCVGSSSSSSLNTITNNNSTDMLYSNAAAAAIGNSNNNGNGNNNGNNGNSNSNNKMSINTGNGHGLEDKSGDATSMAGTALSSSTTVSTTNGAKPKKKLLGWGFLAKYNFIDFDDDAYQDDKKSNNTNNGMMKGRQNNGMNYNSNSSYSMYGNNSINPSFINSNPYIPQTGYGNTNYNGNMMNKMNYINGGNGKGGNGGGVLYNNKNGSNGTNGSNISYQQKNGIVYYNDGGSVSMSNNYNSNGTSGGTSSNTNNNTNGNNKNHSVYHPNSKKGNAKMMGNYNNYYQNPNMVSRNMYNENGNLGGNGNNTRYNKYNNYKNGNSNNNNNNVMNPLNKMINSNTAIKNGEGNTNVGGINEGKNDMKNNGNYSNGKNNSNGNSKKKMNKNSNGNNNGNNNNNNNNNSNNNNVNFNNSNNGVGSDPNAKANPNAKSSTTTKGKKKNRNNGAKNKNNNNNSNNSNNNNNNNNNTNSSDAIANAHLDANIANILNSINVDGNSSNTVTKNTANSTTTNENKPNPPKSKKNNAKANKNNGNNNNSNSNGNNNNKANNTTPEHKHESDSFTANVNVAEFIPMNDSHHNNNNNNEKSMNKKGQQTPSSNNEKNKEVEYYNGSYPSKTNITTPFMESSLYNNKEN